VARSGRAKAAAALRGGLPMYDLPELRSVTDAWWAGLVEHLRAAGVEGLPGDPERPPHPEELWLAPELGLVQTCGYPLTHDLAGQVTYVATPCYRAPGCNGADYRSLILVRGDDTVWQLAALRGRRAAVNAWDSQSGMSALRHAIAPLAQGRPFFEAVIETGGHRASLAALQAGAVDVAAVDCVTFALLQRVAPVEVAGIRRIAWSRPAPGLPLVTRGATGPDEVAALRRGLTAAFADPSLAELRRALLLEGVEVLPAKAYDQLLAMERDAVAAGYPQLA